MDLTNAIVLMNRIRVLSDRLEPKIIHLENNNSVVYIKKDPISTESLPLMQSIVIQNGLSIIEKDNHYLISTQPLSSYHLNRDSLR